MKILLKCPTRTRPDRVKDTLKKYIELCNRPDLLGLCISADVDDETMNNNSVRVDLRQLTSNLAWFNIFYSENKSKIEAVNADMEKIDWEWEIVVLVSDDMIPVHKGYDDVLRSHMMAHFPDTDGILWCTDGAQGKDLNTLSIMGRTMYNSFGYLYHPSYKSLFCDTEFTDLCKTTLSSKCVYISYLLIRHEHPGTGYAERNDSLYIRNQRYWSTDMYNYITRKKYAYDWDILIPTMAGREKRLQALLASINEKKARICSDLKIVVTLFYDNRERKVGSKRQELMSNAKGKYMSFIDDDDEITDAYFEDAAECIRQKNHVCRLRGKVDSCTFTHSIDIPITGPMAVDREFLRPPNHLNVILTDIAKFFKFDNVQIGEDFDFAVRLSKSNFLKLEYKSDPSRIHYIYNVPVGSVTDLLLYGQYTRTIETMLLSSGSNPFVINPRQPVNIRTGHIRFVAGRGFVSK
jgi:glycosyltransferase involved in cell wall biosynthesis